MSPVERQPPAGEDSLAQVIERDRAPIGDLTRSTLGDFQVERLLGRGGMGEVYLATQISLKRPVALKVLRSDVLSKPGYRERFESEAIAVAKLNHPSIVHVYAIGQVP
jgi:eukaryotic-like serine/threonine-protein kinase